LNNINNAKNYNNKNLMLDFKLCRNQLDAVLDLKLLWRSMDTMALFRTESERLNNRYSELVLNNRGIGLTLAITLNNQENRDALVNNLLCRHGI